LNWNKLIQEAETFAKSYSVQDIEVPNQWEIHVPLTRKYAKLLAEKEKANTNIVDLAAILHDIGKDKGRENHHKRSHGLAQTFLEKQDITEAVRELILLCILKHRTKYSGDPDPDEVKIIRSADILAVLFDNVWQEKSRKELTKVELISLYNEIFSVIELDTARIIAKPQLTYLKEKIK
jgi:uncharacterized protein